jgi:hypothetical protein
MTVAETSPLASEADEELLNDTNGEGCQTTVLGSGRPTASSTRAVSAVGNKLPACPVWLSPPRMQRRLG